jgi:type I restriction enzyme S subunit
VDQIGIPSGTTVDPAKYRDEEFELFSVPSYSTGVPEILKGADIGSTKQEVRPGDVLVCKIVPHINRVWVVPEKGSRRQIASSEWIVVRNPHFDPEYLRNCFAGPDFRAEFLKDLTGIGGSLTRARPQTVMGIQVPVPPASEQRRIVEKLDRLFKRTAPAREELAHIPTLVEQYKQAILRKAFFGELTESERELYSWRGPELSADNIDLRSHDLLADLPDEWGWSSMNQVTDVSGGLTKNAARNEHAEQVPYLRVANVYANELRLGVIKTIGCSPAELQKTALERDDLLIVEGNGSLEQIGRVAIWDGSIPRCSHQNHLIRARSKGIVPAKFILYWLLSPVGRQAIERVASSSAGLHTLSITKVAGIPLPVPSHAEAERIVVHIEEAFDWIERVSRERDKATTLLDHLDRGLLGKAFRGELVPQDPTDEPAEQLLERIRSERGAQAPARRGRRGRARA